MKKAAFVLLFFGIFLWGVYYKIKDTRPTDQFIGTVSVVQGKTETQLDGYAILRRYEENAQLYGAPELSELKDYLPIISQAAQALTTTTDSAVVTTTTAVSEPATTAVTSQPMQSVISVASNELGVRYSGEQLLPTVYTVYDAQMAVVMSPRKELRVPISPGIYYVQLDVTWGRTKNYVGAQYFFRVDVT